MILGVYGMIVAAVWIEQRYGSWIMRKWRKLQAMR
jgi:hypothetical protein